MGGRRPTKLPFMSTKTTTRLALTTVLLALGACNTPPATSPKAAGPDYSRPLPPGSSALRLITDPARLPDIGAAYNNSDPYVTLALKQSEGWFKAPSSKTHFPLDGITHKQAQASVNAFQDLLETAPGESSFVGEVRRLFDVYESVGYDGSGIVLFTGYYAPIFPASQTRTQRFAHPLYVRPDDLATHPKTGQPLGRQLPDGSTEPYSTRRQIEESGMFQGRELVWLEDPLSVYIVHVNGSAKLRLPDESIMYVGYAGKTDHEYLGLGKAMVESGLVSSDELSLAAIKRAYKRNPEQVQELIYQNDHYVFFTEYEGDNWPSGSLGVKVTPETSLATDKRIYPRGGAVLVDTKAVTFSSGDRPFLRFMVDQDTGGAINAPGRADIYMGVGPSAEILAGGQYAEGRLYYFFLKPEFVGRYLSD
jgi:membrane-bound lytic murein transglycosylase A